MFISSPYQHKVNYFTVEKQGEQNRSEVVVRDSNYIKQLSPVEMTKHKDIMHFIIGKYNLKNSDIIYELELHLAKELLFYPNQEYTLNLHRLMVKNKLLPLEQRIKVMQFIVYKSENAHEIKNTYSLLCQIAQDTTQSEIIRQDVADILLQSNNSLFIPIAKQVISQLRNEAPLFVDRDLQRALWNDLTKRVDTKSAELKKPIPKRKQKTMYEDKQNTHCSEFNASVLQSAEQLCKMFPNSDHYYFDINRIDDMQDRGKIAKSLTRIQTDPTKFKHNTTLNKVFTCLLNYIENSSKKEELYKRLEEELKEMSKLCATGHLSRLLNTIQGFDDAIKIKIGLDHEIYSYLKPKFEMAIQKAPNCDEIMDDILTDQKKIYITFIQSVAKSEYPQLVREYHPSFDEHEVKLAIEKTVSKYVNPK